MPTTTNSSAPPSLAEQKDGIHPRPKSAHAQHEARKKVSKRATRASTSHRRQTKWLSVLIRLGVFSALWSIFGLLARIGVESMEDNFTSVLPADQLLDMKVTLPMVMGLLALSATQFILRKTGHDD